MFIIISLFQCMIVYGRIHKQCRKWNEDKEYFLKAFSVISHFLPIACPSSMYKKFETNNNQVFNTFYVIEESAFINEISTLLRIF